MLTVVIYLSVSGVRVTTRKRVIHIEKLVPICGLKHFAVDAFVSASDTVHINNAGWRVGKWVESKCVDATGEPVARPISGLRQSRDTAPVVHKYIVELTKRRKPIFVPGYLRRPHFVDPAHANFAAVSPPFNGVDVRKIPTRAADG